MINQTKLLIGTVGLALLVGCGDKEATVAAPTENAGGEPAAAAEAFRPMAEVSQARLDSAAEQPEQWLTYGGSYDETRHSSLTKVNKDTLPELGIGWVYDMKKPRGVEATPIVVDGVMYVTGSWSVVYALDARTGEEIWVYDPEVSGEDAAKGCCDVVNRGLAVYEGKVFVGVFDGRLEALDAKTGAVIWSNVTVDQSKPYTITGAPRVIKDKVIIGNGGAELGVRGYVTAYDTNTGDLVWRFYTVPNPNKEPDGAISDEIFAKLANETWGDTGAWTTDGGGGTVWDAIVYDHVNDQVLLGVGNGSPWNAAIRDPEGNGDNLFLSSILAVDTDTGGRLDAVELDTGEPRWSTPFAGGLSAPVVVGETVVVLQRTEGADARVVGLDRQTGKEAWSTTTLDNGGLFAVLLDDGGVLLGDVDRVDRLDPLTGELTALLSGELVRRGSDAVAAYSDGTVRVAEQADGTPRDERFVGPIGEDGDFVFTDERVVVFDGETIWSINTVGQREWDFTPTEDAAQVRHMVLIPGGTLLASFAGGDGTVALDVETGEVRWRSPVPVDLTGAFDGVLRGAGATSPIQLVDLLDGSDVGSFLDLGGSGNPFANGLYYAVTDDGLTAYRLADGQPLWAVAADELLDRHAIPGGIVLTNADGTLTLLR